MKEQAPHSTSNAFGRRALFFGAFLIACLVASIALFLGNPAYRIGGVAVYALLQFLGPLVGAAYACFLAALAFSNRIPRRAGLALALVLLAAAGYSLVRCWPTLLSA